ncbi:MAG: gluconokinase [Timaviella obliquedivisa GSE-PSE-MK23-08B]|jgi:gluconokinase|nr:gluconokinase [Timaviella obliquedivisa GSE-PSE-MK23-08B]
MVILLIGVSGSGKTTIGRGLALELNWKFKDADDFHSDANIEKMRQGISLNDDDRRPWLQALRRAIDEALQTNANLILACSALKAAYRQVLGEPSEQVKFVYLKGSFELIEQRLTQRQGHYMKANLLRTQFDALEEPPNAIAVEIDQSPSAIAQQIKNYLHL